MNNACGDNNVRHRRAAARLLRVGPSKKTQESLYVENIFSAEAQ